MSCNRIHNLHLTDKNGSDTSLENVVVFLLHTPAEGCDS